MRFGPIPAGMIWRMAVWIPTMNLMHSPKSLRITVVTPSFNQAHFLEQTMLSVLNQRYQDLEYIVIDGGSTDGSVEILERYDHRLAYWTSEPDSGQAHAINKG